MQKSLFSKTMILLLGILGAGSYSFAKLTIHNRVGCPIEVSVGGEYYPMQSGESKSFQNSLLFVRGSWPVVAARGCLTAKIAALAETNTKSFRKDTDNFDLIKTFIILNEKRLSNQAVKFMSHEELNKLLTLFRVSKYLGQHEVIPTNAEDREVFQKFDNSIKMVRDKLKNIGNSAIKSSSSPADWVEKAKMCLQEINAKLKMKGKFYKDIDLALVYNSQKKSFDIVKLEPNEGVYLSFHLH